MATERTRRVGRPPGPPPDPAERRAALLDAAVRTIRREGPGASMEQIAAEAALSKPVLYSYFRDKSGLVDALVERQTDELVPRIVAPLSQPDEPRALVRATIEAYLEFVEREPQLYRFIGAHGRRSGAGPIDHHTVSGVGERLAEALAVALVRVGGDTTHSSLWAFAMLGGVVMGGEWWMAHPELARSEVVDQLTDLVWGGLAGAGLGAVEGPILPG